MTNTKHNLRHDKDNVVLFNVKPFERIVEFDPEWVEREGPCAGLPTKIGAWIKQNVGVGKSVTGVRWLNYYPFYFVLSNFENTFRASFQMPDKRTMTVTPGVIEVARYESSNELLVRYNEFKVEGGTTWKVWFETKRHYDYNYHDCPLNLEVCLSLIDNMLYQITRAPNHNSGKELCSELRPLDDIPYHLRTLFESPKTYQGDFKTPPEIEKYYHYLARLFYKPEHLVVGVGLRILEGDLPPEQRYRALFDKLVTVCREGVNTSELDC